MKYDKPTVGQELFSLNVGNAARRREQVLTPVYVSKVGRKYFSVKVYDYDHETVFNISDWSQKTEYCASERLYSNHKQRDDEVESASICMALSDEFKYRRSISGLNLDTLRAIKDLIDKDKETT